MNTESLQSRAVSLSGYGQREFFDGYLFRPTSVDEVRDVFELAKRKGRKVVLRGSGRSYGDPAIAAECFILDVTRMKRILGWDSKTGVIDVEAGATIETLWRNCLEDGWWPPVVSGTMYPTLAGALAMNIHGKNNYCAGTIGEHVLELDVVFPTGELRTLTPADELFYAIVSGFGMLGAIVRVKMQMKRVHSGNLKVFATSPKNWAEQVQVFERFEHDCDYMVSWVDCFGKNSMSGRGQFHGAWYLHPAQDDVRSMFIDGQDLPDTIMGLVPKSVVWRILKPINNRFGMRFLNWAKDRASRILGDNKYYEQSLVGFSFLLDYVPNWRKAYLPGGFIQFQSFVPKEHAAMVFERQVKIQQEAKLESFLAVMKRHRPDRFLFSHAVDGYSLALDFKVTRRNWQRLQEVCQKMADVVLEAGGRFYFAKDGTLNADQAEKYLGEDTLGKYFRFKTECDPDGLLTSSLARRLKLDSPTGSKKSPVGGGNPTPADIDQKKTPSDQTEVRA